MFQLTKPELFNYKHVGAHHSLGEDSQVYLPLHGSLQDVFSGHAAVHLQRVEEHVAVQPVARSLQT